MVRIRNRRKPKGFVIYDSTRNENTKEDRDTITSVLSQFPLIRFPERHEPNIKYKGLPIDNLLNSIYTYCKSKNLNHLLEIQCSSKHQLVETCLAEMLKPFMQFDQVDYYLGANGESIIMASSYPESADVLDGFCQIETRPMYHLYSKKVLLNIQRLFSMMNMFRYSFITDFDWIEMEAKENAKALINDLKANKVDYTEDHIQEMETEIIDFEEIIDQYKTMDRYVKKCFKVKGTPQFKSDYGKSIVDALLKIGNVDSWIPPLWIIDDNQPFVLETERLYIGYEDGSQLNHSYENNKEQIGNQAEVLEIGDFKIAKWGNGEDLVEDEKIITEEIMHAFKIVRDMNIDKLIAEENGQCGITNLVKGYRHL